MRYIRRHMEYLRNSMNQKDGLEISVTE